ncbi:MAG: PEPxxWA-CTERM sorting domain-containing protein [Sphingomonas sp.]|nr:PEPxxWA-CTERM sorting domain-containing protein [Sphingomonas sp.]
MFINGQLVAVTSFGITGDAFRSNGYCGGFAGQNSIDPYGAGGTTGINANIQGCTNSSVGEISGDTWLKPYQGFINQYLAASVPEPQTWAMMILGFGMVGGVLRTRRREGKLATA